LDTLPQGFKDSFWNTDLVDLNKELIYQLDRNLEKILLLEDNKNIPKIAELIEHKKVNLHVFNSNWGTLDLEINAPGLYGLHEKFKQTQE